jgi:hypothetical protein
MTRWAQYRYFASRARYLWGLRLRLLCTLTRLPAGFALADGNGRRPLPLRPDVRHSPKQRPMRGPGQKGTVLTAAFPAHIHEPAH